MTSFAIDVLRDVVPDEDTGRIVIPNTTPSRKNTTLAFALAVREVLRKRGG